MAASPRLTTGRKAILLLAVAIVLVCVALLIPKLGTLTTPVEQKACGAKPPEGAPFADLADWAACSQRNQDVASGRSREFDERSDAQRFALYVGLGGAAVLLLLAVGWALTGVPSSPPPRVVSDAPPAQPQARPNPTSDPPTGATPAERLVTLKELRDSGLLSESEFEAKRQALIQEL
jgi:hypothetical protein